MSDDSNVPRIRDRWRRRSSGVIAAGIIGGGLTFCSAAGVGLGLAQDGAPTGVLAIDAAVAVAGLGVLLASWAYLDYRDNYRRRTRMRQ